MQNTAVMEQKTPKPGRKKIKLNDPEVLEKIVQLGSQGLTSGQIARCLGVSWSTLNRRRKEFDKIDDAIKRGQALGVSEVANALFNSAVYEKNVTAQIFYLKNRGDEGQWSDKQEVQHNLNLSNVLQDAQARIIEGKKVETLDKKDQFLLKDADTSNDN